MITLPTEEFVTWIRLHIFIPQDLQRDVLALQLPVHRRPVRLRAVAPALPGRGRS